MDSALGQGRLGLFFKLSNLANGQTVEVTLADGVTTSWVTISNVLNSDESFPDAVVYNPTGPPTLRLVAFGGHFDPETGHYQSAVVVTARFIGES